MPIEALPDNTARALTSSLVLNDAKSVVKELVDNALDARATAISVEISANTLDIIQVKDNGTGIGVQDRQLLCKRGCTSKIRSIEDLCRLGGSSLGFRGEALASIAELSQAVTVTTRVDGEVVGTSIKYGASGMISSSSSSHPVGTTIRVQGFLSKIPVRKQSALKEPAKTLQAIKSLLFAFAAARPEVRLSLKVLKGKNDKLNWTYAASPGESLTDVAAKIVGTEMANECALHTIASSDCDIEVAPGWSITAIAVSADADFSKTRNAAQYISIDGRPVSTDRSTIRELAKVYKRHLQHLAPDKSSISRPFLLMQIQCPPESYDVNVEPAKDEVLFFRPKELLSLVDVLFQRVYEPGRTRNDEVGENQDLPEPTSGLELHRDMYSSDIGDFEGQETPVAENDLQDKSEELRTTPTGFLNPFTIAAMTATVKPKKMNANQMVSLTLPGPGALPHIQPEDVREERPPVPVNSIGNQQEQEYYLPSPSGSEASGRPLQDDDVEAPTTSLNDRRQGQKIGLHAWLTPSSEIRLPRVYASGSVGTEDLGSPRPNAFQLPAKDVQNSHPLLSPASPRPNSRWGLGQKPFKPQPKRQSQSFASSSSLSDTSGIVSDPQRQLLQRDLFGIVESRQFSHGRARQDSDGPGHVDSSDSNLELEEIMDFEHRKKAAIAHQRRLAARFPTKTLKDVLKISGTPESSRTTSESEDRASVEGTATRDYDSMFGTPKASFRRGQGEHPEHNRDLAALNDTSHSHPGPRDDRRIDHGERQKAETHQHAEHADEEPELSEDDPRAYVMMMKARKSGTGKIYRTKSSKLPLERIPPGATTVNLATTMHAFEEPDTVRRVILSLSPIERYITHGETEYVDLSSLSTSPSFSTSIRCEWESKLRDLVKTQYRFQARDGSGREMVPHLKIAISRDCVSRGETDDVEQ